MKRTFLVVVAALALAAPAQAATHTKTIDVPISLGPFEVKQTASLAPTPHVDGALTAMRVDVVDSDGTQVPIRRLMLHHIVFSRLGHRSPTCGDSFTAFDSQTKFPNLGEPFYGAGEERNAMVLPPGYGYRIGKDDLWSMGYMLMNHRAKSDHALIRYTVTWDDSPDIAPVHPYWLDVRNCRADPVYDVPGGGRPGSSYKQVFNYTMPESGRVVSAGSHVHGGAKDVTVTEPDCANRTLFRSTPAWGSAAHPFYHVRPILHEPGPVSMRGFLSRQGYPVARGQRLRLTARYLDDRPHTRVMGIAVIYVAPGAVPAGCAPPPTDAKYPQPAQLAGIPFRKKAPRFTVPLTGLDSHGRAVTIERPPGKTVSMKGGSSVDVRNFAFGAPNVSIAQGKTLNWRFQARTLHNVTLASGPRGFSSPNLSDGGGFSYRFSKAGTYRLFCGLHPVWMTQTVQVRAHRR